MSDTAPATTTSPEELITDIRDRLVTALGVDAVLDTGASQEFLDPYAADATPTPTPSLVVPPATVGEIQAVVRIAAEFGVPICSSSQATRPRNRRPDDRTGTQWGWSEYRGHVTIAERIASPYSFKDRALRRLYTTLKGTSTRRGCYHAAVTGSGPGTPANHRSISIHTAPERTFNA